MELIRSLVAGATSGPDYPPDAGDRAEVSLLGLRFPVRATVAILAVTALIVLDRSLLPFATGSGALFPFGGRATVDPVSGQRFVLFLLAPLAIVVFTFRDTPARYGLRLGDWRWGAGLLIAGLVAMLPIILWLSSFQQFREYYGAAGRPLGTLVLDHVLELVSAEFLLRGFLMFTLWRRIGPLALVVQLIPFVLTHIGKPDIELWSTFIGGSVFAWLDWRTGSILWSAIGHVYVLTLMEVAVGGALL